MKIFSKSLYDLKQVKARSTVGEVDGIELLIGFRMGEDKDILQYAMDHFRVVTLETWDYFYDGAGLDLMSDREDVRDTSRRFIDSLMDMTIKYGLFPFSMHLVSGSVPFKAGDALDVTLKKEEDNLASLKEYLEASFVAQINQFCFENCLLLDFMGGEHITLCNVGKVLEDTISINGKACFDLSHYAVNFMICHDAEEGIIQIGDRAYPNLIPEKLMEETRKYKKGQLNDYLEGLIARAPEGSIQRFHFLNMFGTDPRNCEGTLEGEIDLNRMLVAMKKRHPEAIVIPEVKEEDYLNPVKQREILDLVRRV